MSAQSETQRVELDEAVGVGLVVDVVTRTSSQLTDTSTLATPAAPSRTEASIVEPSVRVPPALMLAFAVSSIPSTTS